ncbi:hypothetical protein GUITHDRAFT_165866, partial [Guillardia theta CCMP2712]
MVLKVEKRSVRVEVPNGSNLLFGSFSMQVWVKPKSWSDEEGYQREPGWPVILCKSRSWTDGFGMYGSPPNTIHAYINEWNKNNVSASIDINKWSCILMTYHFKPEGGVLQLYVNGKLVGSRDGLPPMRKNDAPLVIGSTQWGDMGWYAFHGSIGPVTFWNRALKESEVGRVMDRHPVRGEDVVLSLELNETNSKEAIDSSASASNGLYMDSLTPINRSQLPFDEDGSLPWEKNKDSTDIIPSWLNTR